MSYKKKIKINDGLKITSVGNVYVFSGFLGSCKLLKNNDIDVIINDSVIVIEGKNKNLNNLYYTLVKQKIRGVLYGYIKKLKLVGIGYYGEVSEGSLVLKLGYSHPVKLKIPDSIFIKIKKRRRVILMGHDLEKLTEFISFLRSFRPPECYKGKGILFNNEKVFLKVGKKN